MVHVILSYPPW